MLSASMMEVSTRASAVAPAPPATAANRATRSSAAPPAPGFTNRA